MKRSYLFENRGLILMSNTVKHKNYILKIPESIFSYLLMSNTIEFAICTNAKSELVQSKKQSNKSELLTLVFTRLL